MGSIATADWLWFCTILTCGVLLILCSSQVHFLYSLQIALSAALACLQWTSMLGDHFKYVYHSLSILPLAKGNSVGEQIRGRFLKCGELSIHATSSHVWSQGRITGCKTGRGGLDVGFLWEQWSFATGKVGARYREPIRRLSPSHAKLPKSRSFVLLLAVLFNIKEMCQCSKGKATCRTQTTSLK